MKTRLFIYGAGGHGKVAADTAIAMNGNREVVFIDDNPSLHSARVVGLPVIGGRSRLAGALIDEDEVFVAIGDNAARAEASRRVGSFGLALATLVHPLATLSRFASVAEGTLIMPGVVVNACARIGAGCILNTSAVVEHDCVVENYAHLSPGVCVGGRARIGEAAHLGIGAVVLPDVCIGQRAVVGAGCVVHHDLPPGVVAVGVPARIIRFEVHANTSVESEHHESGETRGTRGALDTASLPGPKAS